MIYDKQNITKVPDSFYKGTMCDAYKFFGSRQDDNGTDFLVWAPNACRAFVKVGARLVSMKKSGDLFYLHTDEYIKEYRYVFETDGKRSEKNDPFAHIVNNDHVSEVSDCAFPPCKRLGASAEHMNIFEVHLGSWAKKGEDMKALAQRLGDYALDMGYNFVELMPVTFHPFEGSWGYQTGGYFATSYGSPQEFAEFVHILHSKGLGVIADWVPGHFACDFFGLSEFDGTPLYESEDESLSQNRLWGTVNTDFSKPEVCSFMLSSACFLTDVLGFDGIRVDAVSNMLIKGFEGYRSGILQGDINIHALSFLKTFTHEMKKRGVITIAEDTAHGISATSPLSLGFDRVWNMGWFHDTTVFLSAPPKVRCELGQYLLKPFGYMNDEKYVLPVSHDENTCGKGTLLKKLPRDNGKSYRLLLSLMAAFPGDKLIFSGTEYAAQTEWDGASVQPQDTLSCDMLEFSKMLNHMIKGEACLRQGGCELQGFYDGVLIFTRQNPDDEDDFIIFVFNFSDIEYEKYLIGIDRFVDFEEIFISSGERKCRKYFPEGYELNNKNFRTEINLPPLCGLGLRPLYPWKKNTQNKTYQPTISPNKKI